jgi:hypothetical protein
VVAGYPDSGALPERPAERAHRPGRRTPPRPGAPPRPRGPARRSRPSSGMTSGSTSPRRLSAGGRPRRTRAATRGAADARGKSCHCEEGGIMAEAPHRSTRARAGCHGPGRAGPGGPKRGGGGEETAAGPAGEPCRLDLTVAPWMPCRGGDDGGRPVSRRRTSGGGPPYPSGLGRQVACRAQRRPCAGGSRVRGSGRPEPRDSAAEGGRFPPARPHGARACDGAAGGALASRASPQAWTRRPRPSTGRPADTTSGDRLTTGPCRHGSTVRPGRGPYLNDRRRVLTALVRKADHGQPRRLVPGR